MRKTMKNLHGAAFLALMFLHAGSVVFGQQKDGQTVQEMLSRLQDKKTGASQRLELVRELGKLGPAAEPALEVLLDPEFYMGQVRNNPALKKVVIDTLISIGEPSVKAVLDLNKSDPKGKKREREGEPAKEEDPATAKREAKLAHRHAKKREKLKRAMQDRVNDLLRQLAAGGLEEDVIAALEQQLMTKKKINTGVDFVPLAQIGPAAGPALKRVMKARKKFDAYTVGPDPEFMPRIPERYWPEFRGPYGNGHSDSKGLPLRWSATENVAWKTEIHDVGWSSPVVWGDQVWMTTATRSGKQVFAVCVDRNTGKVLHDVKVFDVRKPQKINSLNSHASPTPAIEEGRVYVHYGSYGTACLDTNTGKVLWARRDLTCEHHMGPGSSPILHGKRLIFNVDGIDVQYVIALDKATGKTAWKTARSVDYRRVHRYCRKAFSTPSVVRSVKQLQLVSPGSKGIFAYDPDSGDELWKVRHNGWSMIARPILGHGLLYVVTDYDHPELWALRPGGRGDVTDTHVAWKIKKDVPATPSLLLDGGLLYMVSDKGKVSCIDAKSGKVVWAERLGGQYLASPVHAEGRIYLFNRKGQTTVIAPGRELKVLATNSLGQTVLQATPAVAGNAFLIRTATHLYRIEEPGGEKADGLQRHITVVGNVTHRDRDKRPGEEQVLAAIEALGKSGSGQAVKPLIKLFDANHPREIRTQYRTAIVKAIGELGPEADKSIPHILVHEFVCKRGGPNYDSRNPVRLAGIDALVSIGPGAVPDVILMLGIPRERGFNWNHWGQVILKKLAEKPKCVDVMEPTLVRFAKAGEYRPEYTFVLDLMGPEKALAALRKIDAEAIMGPTLDAVRRESGSKLIARARVLGLMSQVYSDKEFLAPLDKAMVEAVTSKQEIDKQIADLEKKIDAQGDSPDKELGKELGGLKRRQTGASRQWTRLVEATAMVGPKAVPVLLKQMDVGNDPILVAGKIGPAAKGYFEQLIPTRLEGTGPKHGPGPKQRGQTWEWPKYLTLSQVATPESRKHIPTLVKSLEVDDYGMTHYIGMVLDRMAPHSVMPVAKLLDNKDDDWYGRWAATAVLEMMGPKAKDALPKLEKAFSDENEDIDVRVGAARAIARIKGTDPFDLYKQIPDVERRIIKTTKAKTRAWREVFCKREGATPDPGGWPGCARWLYCLSSKQQLDQVNRSLKKCGDQGGIGSFMDVNFVRVLALYHSKSRFYPDGRLYPETEAAMKGCFFRQMDKKKQKLWNANIPMNMCSRSYLALEILKDDPKYKDRTFSQGDTVQERYRYWRETFTKHLEHWVANGLWDELGSSNYEYHTFPSYVNLAELAVDKDISRLATMFMDIALVEAAQQEIAGLRGGTKCRAKRGGLGSTWNPYKAMLYGYRGATLYHSSFAVSDYYPPDAAILLTKLGPRNAREEIVNLYAGRERHPINYVYRTPEYVSGCVMYHPNRHYGANNEGRWTGVIYRDLTSIGLPAYCTEKWNVQSKDARILQGRRGAYYGGWPRVNFSSGLDLVEKGGWIFADNGEAFGAVNILDGGYFWADPLRHAAFVVRRITPIVMQTGTKKDYGSFEAFQKAVLNAPLSYKDNKVTYHGPNSDKLEFFCMMDKEYDGRKNRYRAAYEEELAKAQARDREQARKKGEAKAKAEGKTGRDAERLVQDMIKSEERANRGRVKEEAEEAIARRGIKEKDFTLPKINGKTIDVDPPYAYRSPYLKSRVDSGVVTVTYGDRAWEYDIKNRTVREK